MKKLYKHVGEYIIEKRGTLGYTREDLAERANISAKFLYEIETGKKGFSVFVLHKLCAALQISPNDVISEGMHLR